MKYEDIPKFINPPNYFIHTDWKYIEETLDQYNDRASNGSEGLDLNPDFQRGHVWTEDKRIKFIEFCLMGGQSSRTILFNHPNWMGSYKGQMVLVDGKQRLESVRLFNKLPIFGGYYLNDFEDPKRLLRCSDAYLEFRVNNLKTRKEILTWYLQINSGGVVHTEEELNRVRDLLEKEN
jgi:hypothetical protein